MLKIELDTSQIQLFSHYYYMRFIPDPMSRMSLSFNAVLLSIGLIIINIISLKDRINLHITMTDLVSCS